ncbi:hypothetical protein Pan258_55530 [Symmachiella dynata]|uniref:hypothetical protein n=1 Tax=Symmachiella dynata TaxID=2527995 RepID=UPI0011879A67|nr:hypothetical protein [Symmachiella dynata]QDT51464.1 hypothetical protein Pan258_55530 [Symmachiella dynata]
MAKTFPIQCHSCTEILDVAADMDVTAPYDCPMCGAAIEIAEAEDFDLPCPAAVVIEEQTPERLRLRVVESPRGSDGYYLALLFMGIGIVLIGYVVLVLNIDFDYPFPLIHNNIIDQLFFGLISLGGGTLQLTAARSLELAGENVTIRYYVFGLDFFRRRTRSTLIDSVYTVPPHANFKPLRVWQVILAVGSKFHTRRSILTPNPDLARYVTHLLRRHLITIGHELQDG